MKYYPAYVIWYGDLQDLVKEYYGIDLNILDILFEPNQNSYTAYTIDGNTELDSIEDVGIVKYWIATGEYQNIDPVDVEIEYPDDYNWKYHRAPKSYNVEVKHILHRLYKDGHIPSGKWILTVWW